MAASNVSPLERLHQKGRGTVFERLSPQSVIMRTNHDDRNGVSRLVQLTLQVQAVRSRKVKTNDGTVRGIEFLEECLSGNYTKRIDNRQI
jgi:hypothetical protein